MAKQSPVRGPLVVANSKDLPVNTKSQVVHTKDFQLIDDTEMVNIIYSHLTLYLQPINGIIDLTDKGIGIRQSFLQWFLHAQWIDYNINANP